MASAAWEARNARARALGYENYYDYRAHGYGRQPAGEPRASGAALQRLRGHASAADFEQLLARGQVELVNVVQPRPGEYEVLATLSDGSQRTFYVKGSKVDRVQKAIADAGPAGPQLVGSPRSLGRLLPDVEEEELREEEGGQVGLDEEYSTDDSDIPF